MYCMRILVVTLGYSSDSLDICYGINLRILVTLGINALGLITCFHDLFSDRNLGALFEVLCVGLSIMNLKLFDAYRIINSWILVVTLEYLGDIRVG